MSFSAINVSTKGRRAGLILVVVVMLFGAFLAAKWNFANSASTRVDRRDIADLVVQLGPDDPQTHFARAFVYDQTFDAADAAIALNEFETTAQLSPNNFMAWLELGKALERSGDLERAAAAIDRASSLAPSYADVAWANGNFLLRAGDNDPRAFDLIRAAVASRASYAGPAVVTAMAATGGDASAARILLGDTPAVNAALASMLLGAQRFDEAADAWGRLPAEAKRNELKDIGKAFAAKALAAYKYRLAAIVTADTGADPPPVVGAVTNGGFESGVRLKDSGEFDWRIADGPEPQITLSDRARTGGNSLWLLFNTSRASDFRGVNQTVAVETRATYQLSAFYRSELRTNVTMHLEVVDATSNAVLATTRSVGLNADWTELNAPFTVPETTDGVTIRLVRDPCPSPICPISGKFWLDDIGLTKVN